jgi:hypothetical protein
MIPAFNREIGGARILSVILIDCAAIAILSWLVVRRDISLYPLGVIGFASVIAITFAFLYRRPVEPLTPSRSSSSRSRLLRLAAIVFTVGGVVEIAACVQVLDVRSVIQAVLGVILAGYFWFLVHMDRARARNSGKQP